MSKRQGKAINNLDSYIENIRATPLLERFLLGLTANELGDTAGSLTPAASVAIQSLSPVYSCSAQPEILLR